jgi:iron complex transport system substrate-binding protein
MRSVLLILLLILWPLSGIAGARSVTDHDGRTVEVPDMPQRIVSLHDWTLTVMGTELGAPLVASTGRMAPDGSTFIRGARELFGLDFTRVELASIHGKPDLERIRALKPDLIVANAGDYSALAEQLTSIAPTLMFNPENGKPGFELYREFAGWIGMEPRFEEMQKSYRARVEALRTKLSGTTEGRTYAAILTNGRDGTLNVLKEYGVLTTVLDDLGFARIPLADTVPAGASRMTIGAELIGELDADVIVTSYLPETGGNPDLVFEDLDRIAPGYRDFLRAYADKKMFSFSRYEVFPTSFKGAERLLEQFEQKIQ